MQDMKLTCKDCGKEFDFTAGEQEFYEKNNFTQPMRCKECRDAKKAARSNNSNRNGFRSYKDAA